MKVLWLILAALIFPSCAMAQCSIVTENTLLGYFSDSGAAGRITPALMRNFVCSVPTLLDNNTYSGTQTFNGGGTLGGNWAGDPTATGNWLFSGSATFSGAVTVGIPGQASIGGSGSAGALIVGSGSVCDVTLANQNAQTALCVLQGKKTVGLVASTTGGAPFNVPQGTAPTSPNNGDIWTTSAGIFARINGTTQTVLSTPAFTLSPRTVHTCGIGGNSASSAFTNQTPVSTEFYVAEVLVPANMTITGVSVFNGTVASGNMKVGLATSAGLNIATSVSTAVSGTNAYQNVAFTGTYAAVGPATYYVEVFYDNNTTRANAFTVAGGCGISKATTQVFATGFTTITPPTTFTTAIGPVASLYEGAAISLPTIQTALNAGELSPDVFGRTDLTKYHMGCSTLRNMFASYRGGVYSRPGTLFCGQCLQGNQGTADIVPPPRNIAFQFSVTQGITIEAGEKYFRFLTDGGYILETPLAISTISRGNPGVVTTFAAHGFATGNEVFISGVKGMVQVNQRSFLIVVTGANTFQLINPLTGQGVNTADYLAYTSGGTVGRVYTIATPYAASDLPLLKFAQSADVMTLTHPSYPPYDLARIAETNWTLTKETFNNAPPPPNAIVVGQSSSGISSASFYYQFVATAVDAVTGQESVASPVGSVLGVDASTEAATAYILCASVDGAGSYNFYQAPVAYKIPPTAGAIFGYIGSSFGPTFTDSNLVPDYTTSPPLHRNPFATSSLLAVIMTNLGSGYNATATTATVVSPIGIDPVLTPVISGGEIVWVVVATGGEGLTGGEAVNFVDSTAAGSGAAATITIGPATGTYPSCVAYFQQRRFYANTLNQPDTYFASQPGSFSNMDTSLPTQADDAITGSPWSQQVNGIQWMLNMPGGLVIFTGLGAWQLSGGGGGLATAVAITPSSQVANPQAYNGCSPLVPPIPINYDILYVQEKGSIVRDLSYNFFVNIYTGTDMTVLSNHLFDNHTIIQWAWAEEPNKLLWAIRDDGILLCLTYLKEQDVYAWSRHDTNGLFQSVCTVSEPPVNAPYFIVKRLIQNHGSPVWAYFQERMDDRLWKSQETSWCVDAGLGYPASNPAAALTVSSAAGVPTLNQPELVYGGANYDPTSFVEIVDPTGVNASGSVTIAGGVVIAASVSGTLQGYTNPVFRVIDPTGQGGGAVINIFSTNMTTLATSPGMFANVAGSGEAGDIIRYGGFLAVITQHLSANTVVANVLQSHQPTITDDPYFTLPPAQSGQWSIAAPISTVYGLDHLEGMTVSIIADGVVVVPQTVTNGTVTLPQPATIVTVGLPFAVQMQTMYLDIQGGVTVQGRRKEIDSVVVRLSTSGTPFDIGVNQPDASTQPGMVNIPWTNMTSEQGTVTGSSTPLQPYDLNTDDVFCSVIDQLGVTGGQIALQQLGPVPLNLLAVVPWTRLFDDTDAV